MKRNRRMWAAGLLVLAVALVALLARGGARPTGAGRREGTTAHHHGTPPPSGNPRLDPDWDGDGQPVSFAFGGDVHFPTGTNLGDRLAADPTDALGPTVPELLSGVDISMVNLESALTDGTCPDAQPKQYVFYAPQSAIDAFKGAGVTLITEANNHGEDCGGPGLQMALAGRTQSGYTILGIGQNASQAFTPYETTIHGERIAIVAATQVIDSGLQGAWTATTTQPGLASAYDVDDLVAAVESARRWADTVVVYLHWGTELDACPNPLQEPLAQVLVQAGADVVVGTHAHVLLGGGYLGSAYVDYGLGNFAFYDNSAPENASGSLVISVTGRH
ncbi:MAG TPA: CapA family protein, partial [Acidimicrobiales bacterium]|nr:CapA family protein [Acidimicrobiales bacterium]